MSRLNINKLKNKSKIGTIIYNHIINNKRGYLVVTILFFIGIIIGVLWVNNTTDDQITEINSYLNDFINKLKNYEEMDSFNLFKQSLTSNFIIIILLWFGSSTIIGILIVYGIVSIKGFTIGCTISSIISCFGVIKGIVITLTIMLLHNIIVIPTILAASVSGLKFYQSIMKNKEKDNIKLEILRHTIFCTIMLIFMVIASLIETYVSTNLFIFLLKNIYK